VKVIHQFEVGAPIVALDWGNCGVALRAFTRDGCEKVLDTGSGRVERAISFVEGQVARVVCRPRSDRSSYITANGVLGGLDENTPRLEGVRDVTWSPCGRFLAVLNERGLAIWNADKRKLFEHPQPQAEYFESMAWNPAPDDGCGQLAAAAASSVLLWSARGALTRRELPCPAAMTAMAWHPGGQYLAFAHQNGAVRIWDRKGGECIRLHGSVNAVRRFLWDRKGKLLIGITLKALHVWNLFGAMHFGAMHSGRTHACAEGGAPLTDAALRGCGNLLATGDLDGKVELRRLNSTTTLLQAMTFRSSISHLSWSASARRLAVAIDSGEVYVVRVCR
jgi:WD40 repeat protein